MPARLRERNEPKCASPPGGVLRQRRNDLPREAPGPEPYGVGNVCARWAQSGEKASSDVHELCVFVRSEMVRFGQIIGRTAPPLKGMVEFRMERMSLSNSEGSIDAGHYWWDLALQGARPPEP